MASAAVVIPLQGEAGPCGVEPDRPRAAAPACRRGAPDLRMEFREYGGSRRMKDSLAPGLAGMKRHAIDEERTIDFMGEALRVYSTPSMLRDVEHTCRDVLLPHLDEGEDTVGVRVELDHLGATLLDSWVEVSARVTGVEGPRIDLEVEVRDELGETVGRARHGRFVVEVERQRRRLERLAERLRAGRDG